MPTPDQKRQAAAIITAASEGKVIEYNYRSPLREWRSVDPFEDTANVLCQPERYRIAPDPIAPGWNPDKLTVSQVGKGWRLLEENEIHPRKTQLKKGTIEAWDNGWWQGHYWLDGSNSMNTYRTRLSVEALAALDKPSWRLPDPPAGKRWHREDGWTEADLPRGTRPLLKGEKPQPNKGDEFRRFDDTWYTPPGAHNTADYYQGLWRTTRPLPIFNPRDIPGFRPLLPTEQPHRPDFTEADLPDGWRPLLKGERYKKDEDQIWMSGHWEVLNHNGVAEEGCSKMRSRRPLPSVTRIRWWSKPKDVPGPVCWIGTPNVGDSDDFCGTMVIGVRPEGVHCFNRNGIIFLSWQELERQNALYSLDRKIWAKCETTEAE